jgi:anti-sigma regulatory factor (Ser/Thr protein kinase)
MAGRKTRKSRQNPAVREFILRNIDAHSHDIGALAAERFQISRQAVHGYLQRLISDRLLEASGQTNARSYKLADISKIAQDIKITPGMYEHEVWDALVRPKLVNLPDNIVDICQYGFNEMLNNVIDHSESEDALINYDQTYTTVTMLIADHGIGIFEKIRKDFSLADSRDALLELSKGKLTSDASKHSGEGIFFTSRMFDRFEILSGNLFYARFRSQDDESLIETDDRVEFKAGTSIRMVIASNANWTAKEVFDRYQDDEYRFSKTHVPVSLARYGKEQLVSRSQAKRVLARFDKFSEVMLDFQDVPEVGQAFADEIFRVYAIAHPGVKIIAINTSPEIDRMIAHVGASNPNAPNRT